MISMAKNKTFKPLLIAAVAVAIPLSAAVAQMGKDEFKTQEEIDAGLESDAPIDTLAYAAELAELNSRDPEQNTSYVSIEDMLDRDIQDDTHRAIGSVKDMLVNKNGAVEMIIADMDGTIVPGGTLPLNPEIIALQVNDNSFQVPMHRDQLAEALASQLNDIQTAGPGNLTSARSLIGRPLYTANNRRLGNVSGVLMDKNARNIVSVIIDKISSLGPNTKVALPFNKGMIVRNTGFNNTLYLQRQYAQALDTYISSQTSIR